MHWGESVLGDPGAQEEPDARLSGTGEGQLWGIQAPKKNQMRGCRALGNGFFGAAQSDLEDPDRKRIQMRVCHALGGVSFRRPRRPEALQRQMPSPENKRRAHRR